jgi:hypothetical protein
MIDAPRRLLHRSARTRSRPVRTSVDRDPAIALRRGNELEQLLENPNARLEERLHDRQAAPNHRSVDAGAPL